MQAEYAAADAYIAVEIFMEIVHSKLMKQQVKGGDNMTNDAVRSKMASMCQGILDVNFKDGGQKNKDTGQKNQVRKQAWCSACHVIFLNLPFGSNIPIGKSI